MLRRLRDAWRWLASHPWAWVSAIAGAVALFLARRTAQTKVSSSRAAERAREQGQHEQASATAEQKAHEAGERAAKLEAAAAARDTLPDLELEGMTDAALADEFNRRLRKPSE